MNRFLAHPSRLGVSSRNKIGHAPSPLLHVPSALPPHRRNKGDGPKRVKEVDIAELEAASKESTRRRAAARARYDPEERERLRGGDKPQSRGDKFSPTSSSSASFDRRASSQSASSSARSNQLSVAWQRTELRCPHFRQSCPGCEKEVGLNRPGEHLRAAAFFASRGVPKVPLFVGDWKGWRLRAKLAVRPLPLPTTSTAAVTAVSAEGGSAVSKRSSAVAPALGLYLRGSHDLLRIPDCTVHSPRINEAAAAVEKAIAATPGLTIYDETSGKGLLRYVQFTVTSLADVTAPSAPPSNFPAVLQQNALLQSELHCSDFSLCSYGDLDQALVQLTLVLNAPDVAALPPALLPSLRTALESASSQKLFHSIALNFNTSRGNAIFGPTFEVIQGPPLYLQALPTPFPSPPIAFSPGSFQQANLEAFSELLGDLIRYIPQRSRVADLFAGVGVIGLLIAASGRSSTVSCIELNPESARPFAASSEILRLWSEARAKRGLGPGVPEVTHLVAAAGSDPIRFLAGHDVCVVDPPRKGMEASLTTVLTDPQSFGRGDPGSEPPLSTLRRLVYVSCGLPALERDTDLLLKSGLWEIVAAKCYSFFPGTEAVETMVVFERK